MSKSNIYLERIKQVQRSLKEEKIGALFVHSPVDLFYLTGLKLSLGHLWIKEKGAQLFVDGRYWTIAQNQSPVPIGKLEEKEQVAFLRGVKKIGFDSQTLTYSDFLSLGSLRKKTKSRFLARPKMLRDLRLIKSPFEIAKLRKSAILNYKAYQYIRKQLKEGVSEIELAKKLEIYCLKQGAEKMAFEPIIAFGKNSALPHHHPGSTKLKDNQIVLFDLGVVLDGYASDMTRVDFFGKVASELENLHAVNRAAQKVALAKCRPGVRLKELDLAARRVMDAAKLEHYYVHSLGHGIGLEVHEYPRVSHQGADRNLKLESGMVLTIEPGLYLPQKGGVRYEDTVVITPKGVENLYPS